MNEAAISMNPGARRRVDGRAGSTRRRAVRRAVRGRLGFLFPILIGGTAIALGLLLWQFLASHGTHLYLDFENVPTPRDVGSALLGALQTPAFYEDVGVSVLRIAGSFGLAAILGVAMGVAIGRYKWFRWAFMPYVEIVRPIPAITWIPLAILIWPTTEESILFITFLGAFFPIVLNTIQGVEATPGALINAAKTLGAKEWNVLFSVVIPSALPSITSGAAIGMGVSWFSLVAGEMIGGRAGIGYYTWNAYQLIQYSNIVVGMITIGVLSTLSTRLIYLIRYPLLRWQRA